MGLDRAFVFSRACDVTDDIMKGVFVSPTAMKGIESFFFGWVYIIDTLDERTNGNGGRKI